MGRALQEVAPGVFVATSRRWATTSTLLVDDRGQVIVVDPAWDPDELAALAAEIAARSWQVMAGVATHHHYDHVLWHPDLGSVPRWGSATTVRVAEEQRSENLRELGPDFTGALGDLVGQLTVATDQTWGSLTMTVIPLVHDAHAVGHTALLLPDAGVLIAGDMLSDVELPMPADDDVGLANYVTGLDVLAPAVARAQLLVPGHGTPSADPAARLRADSDYVTAVRRGIDAADDRRSLAGMTELHQSNRELAMAGANSAP